MPTGCFAHEELTFSVIGAFYEVYNHLGHGFLEHIYLDALELELIARGHRVAREVNVQVYYKGHPLRWQRLDMVVDEKLVVEGKSTTRLPPEARPQLYNYLKASRLEVGLLLHFGPEPKFYRLDFRHTPADVDSAADKREDQTGIPVEREDQMDSNGSSG